MVTFVSSNPQLLLTALKSAIAAHKVETWAEVSGYFTHTPSQWSRKAFFSASINGQHLNFSIVPPTGSKISVEVYAVYHGRLLEMMLAHFDKSFSTSSATAQPALTDRVAA